MTCTLKLHAPTFVVLLLVVVIIVESGCDLLAV